MLKSQCPEPQRRSVVESIHGAPSQPFRYHIYDICHVEVALELLFTCGFSSSRSRLFHPNFILEAKLTVQKSTQGDMERDVGTGK